MTNSEVLLDQPRLWRGEGQVSMFSMRSAARGVPLSARVPARSSAAAGDLRVGDQVVQGRPQGLGGGFRGVHATGHAQFHEPVGVHELFGGLRHGDHRDACQQSFAAAAHNGVGDEGVGPVLVKLPPPDK